MLLLPPRLSHGDPSAWRPSPAAVLPSGSTPCSKESGWGFMQQFRKGECEQDYKEFVGISTTGRGDETEVEIIYSGATLHGHVCVCVCVCVRARACVRACAGACVRARMRACVRACWVTERRLAQSNNAFVLTVPDENQCKPASLIAARCLGCCLFVT